MKISKKEVKGKKKKWDIRVSKTCTDMGTISAILSRKGTRRSAVDLDKLMKLSGLSEKEVKKAMKDLKEFGMKIHLTDDNPPRFYWPK